MKIEKLSENQIRCTLNKSDLASRQLKISELAYGSEKAKELFRDMMQQASYELGFEADDIPIMIEAIPVSADCIVLIVTKVDDPEELDTRFSKFTPSTSDYEDRDTESLLDEYSSLQASQSNRDLSDIPTAEDELPSETKSKDDHTNRPDLKQPEDILNLFSKVREYLNKNIAESSKTESTEGTDSIVRRPTDFDPEKSVFDHSSKTADLTDAKSSDAESHQDSKDTTSNLHDLHHLQDVPEEHDDMHHHTDSEQADHTDAKQKDSFVPLKDTIDSKAKHNSAASKSTKKNDAPKTEEKVVRVFTFDSFNHFNQAAIAVYSVYNDRNSLYKDPRTSKYYLTIEKTVCTAVNFNKTCNILSEYGKKEHLNTSSVNFFSEHLELIIKNKAIQIISRI